MFISACFLVQFLKRQEENIFRKKKLSHNDDDYKNKTNYIIHYT